MQRAALKVLGSLKWGRKKAGKSEGIFPFLRLPLFTELVRVCHNYQAEGKQDSNEKPRSNWRRSTNTDNWALKAGEPSDTSSSRKSSLDDFKGMKERMVAWKDPVIKKGEKQTYSIDETMENPSQTSGETNGKENPFGVCWRHQAWNWETMSSSPGLNPQNQLKKKLSPVTLNTNKKAMGR